MRRFGDAGGKDIFIDQNFDIGLIQHIGQLFRRIEHGDIDDHPAGAGGAEKHAAIFDAVAAEDADLAALAKTKAQKRMGKTTGLPVQIAIADGPVLPQNGALFRKALG